MATPQECFDLDFWDTFAFEYRFCIANSKTSSVLEGPGLIKARLHIDFTTGVRFFSILIPNPEAADHVLIDLKRTVEKINLAQASEVLVPPKIKTHSGISSYSVINDGRTQAITVTEVGGAKLHSDSLSYNGRVIIYANFDMTEKDLTSYQLEMADEGLSILFRGLNYASERFSPSAPKVFISHASPDKEKLARPIAHELSNRRLNVWYDEFSLLPGDSLRSSIEKGLKECDYCILVLTQNFLSKGGWTRNEFDSIFTRETLEDKKIIIPIWNNVTVGMVAEYSPLLADKFAPNICDSPSPEDIETICDKFMPVFYPGPF